MKKTKKVIKRIPKKVIAFVMLIAMILSYIMPLTNVDAVTVHGEGDKFINANLNNQLGFTVNSKTINAETWANDEDEFHTTNDYYHIIISVSGNETTGEKVPDIQYGGNWNDYIEKASFKKNNIYEFVLDIDISGAPAEERAGLNFLGLSIIEKEEQPQPGEGGGENPQPGEESHEPHFDGRAVVLWSCGDGVCYHEFNNIPSFDDGNSTFYKDTEIEADNKEGVKFDVHAKYKGWYLTDKLVDWEELYKTATGHVVDWNTLDPEVILGVPMNPEPYKKEAISKGICTEPKEGDPGDKWDEFEGCIDEYIAVQGKIWSHQLQPVGEPTDNNAYVSYGDRNFKVVIYNSKFKGITMGDLSDLHYYPARWANAFLRTDQYDISDTTKEKPALMDSILLESTVKIKALNYNSFEITNIEALDVPENAVKITKENDEFELVFSSNFYDNVVFKVTDNNKEVSYIQIKRYTIDGWIKFVDNHPVLTADFYFDRERSYKDFNLTAKIVYKNGNTKTVTLTPHKGVDDGLGNYTDAYEVDQEYSEFGPSGKGLKLSTFEFALSDGEDRNISKVYLNAEYKGSTATNYAGAYVGSGQGTLANLYQEEDGE